MGETYRSAGVDLAAGDEAVDRIRRHVARATRPEVLGGIGGFGGLFELPLDRWERPVLVSSTDGVGTKLLVAEATGRLDTVGIDLVAMCVDDLVCQGAEPLFMLDYVAVGRLDPVRVETIVSGVAEGCRRAGCALVGGEVAEHPDGMDPDAFDLAGFAVGAVERDRILTGAGVAPGDVLVALPSPGLRSNGYSLARRVLLQVGGLGLDDPAWRGADRSVADELLEPSVIYAPAVLDAIASAEVHAVAHITGGGIPGNLNRVLPADADATVATDRWEAPRIFGEIQRLGGVAPEEMASVFNLGVGMVLVVAPDSVGAALEAVGRHGHRGVVMGGIEPGTGRVRMVDGSGPGR
jgi:phosphoribosylformylglycinamidine cyclo-ligase